MGRRDFSEWITELDEQVIQGEYGYEAGEFAVYPDEWRPDWRAGLSPRAAFEQALKAFADERDQRDAEQKANWARIQREDAAAITRQTARP